MLSVRARHVQVARDIEDPYHYDPNELPLPQLQYRLNERLISVSMSKRPIAFTDVARLSGPGNTINFGPIKHEARVSFTRTPRPLLEGFRAVFKFLQA
jgi:hypothetical protein